MRVAAVQLNSTAEKAANMEAADRLTRAAAADGARLIVLPEKWSALGSNDDLRAGAETLDGPAIAWARAIARELTIDLVAGSIVECFEGGAADRMPASRAPLVSVEGGAVGRMPAGRNGDSPRRGVSPGFGRAPLSRSEGRKRLANTSVHIDPTGEVRAVYRKLHMFDVEVEGRLYCESAVTEPGEEIVLSTTAAGVELGLSICYDLRFPELYRILALRGAQLLPLPAAFTLPTTRDHWEVLVRARAIENQAFVVAANQVGEHPGGHHSGGRSMIVDPWGVVLAQAEDREGHIAADLELERQEEIRLRFPALANRRPEVYRWPEEALR